MSAWCPITKRREAWSNGTALRFGHIPVDRADKATAWQALDALFADVASDAIVLARYMQILPAWLCDAYAGRILAIHHSFLPSFVGAGPYRQAWERGVKQVGATCHYVTAALDQDPIIEQEVMRGRHDDTVRDLVRDGRTLKKRCWPKACITTLRIVS